MTPEDRAALRRAYMAFRAGAGLSSTEVERLLAPLGLSNNALRNLGRDSDRSLGITPPIFAALMRAWATEQKTRQV